MRAEAVRPEEAFTTIAGSADPFGGFELGEFLQHHTDGITDQVDATTSTDPVEQLGQGRL